MTEKEMMKISVEEFARVQKYMLLIDNKDSAVCALHLFFLP